LHSYRFRSRIDDSKRLSELQRQRAFAEIVEKATLGVGWADVDIISEVNILNATRHAMHEALSDLPCRPDFVIVDGAMRLDVEYPYRGVIKADQKSISVAAASIVAKVLRDSLMYAYHARYPQYDFASHKGYGTKKHKMLIKRLGPLPIHRKTFNLA
jgi:ribonuclease HII